jgi:molybdate transport system ATP-binding protein
MNLLMTQVTSPSIVDPAARVGVLLYHDTIEVDPILAAAVKLVQAQGIAVAGLLQRFGDRLPNGKRRMWVDDITTGQSIRLDQPRGPGAKACILDPDALTQCACLLQRAVASDAELIVVSRFGNAEADGSGLRDEIADAICSGVAVLIPVKFSMLDDLEGFLGGPASLLLPSPVSIADWAQTMVTGR